MASMSNTLSKSNNVNKERNNRRKVSGAISKEGNKKKSAIPKPASSNADEFSSSYGEYIVPEASDNGDDNDSDKEDWYGYTYDLEIGAHYKSHFYQFWKEIMSQQLDFGEWLTTKLGCSWTLSTSTLQSK